MKSIFTSLLATSLTLTAFADQKPAHNHNHNHKAPHTPAPAMMDPNPMARWGTNSSSNLFLTGEVVFLKPLTDEQTQFASTTTAAPAQTVNAYKEFQNTFKPGFRVALGYNTNYDGWDLVLGYTGLYYKHDNKYSNSTANSSGVLNPNYTGKLTYKYNFNLGDLDLGRMFKVSSKLNLRPHAGVRGLWLTQKASAAFANQLALPSALTETKKFTGTLVGLEAGLDSTWMIAKEFSVYANVGLATLVNSQKASVAGANVLGGSSTTVSYNYSSRIVNGFDFAIGLRWDRNFSDGDYHFGINLGYEQHGYVNINSTAAVGAVSGANGSLPFSTALLSDKDFSLQGLALGVRFDF